MKKSAFVAVSMWLSYLFGSLLVMAFIGGAGPVHAAEFFCSSGDVSCLIAAINEANLNSEENTINLAAGTYTLTSIDNTGPGSGNTNGLPRITSPMIINGESAETTIIERDSGAPNFRIFDVAASGRLTLNGLTVRGGGASVGGNPSLGGGINNDGTLTVTDSIIQRNRAGSSGGGIANRGDLALLRSIVTANTTNSPFFGGGIYNIGTATIISSSITHNILDGSGGGIANGDTLIGTLVR